MVKNSAAGETNDVTEENIQGGIAKIQSADNVIGFIPNAQARATGIIRAKFLKSRDSGAVGHYVDFTTDWKTLSFIPWSSEDGGGATTWRDNANSNLPSQNGKNQREFTKREKIPPPKNDVKSVKIIKESNDESDPPFDVDDDKSEPVSASSVIRGIKGRNKPHQKKIKLL